MMNIIIPTLLEPPAPNATVIEDIADHADEREENIKAGADL